VTLANETRPITGKSTYRSDDMEIVDCRGQCPFLVLQRFSLLKLTTEHEQVAQLWQRDLAKLDTFSINVQFCLQNHA